MQVPLDNLAKLKAEIEHKLNILSLKKQLEIKQAQLLSLQISQRVVPLSPKRLLPYHCGLDNLGNTCYMASVLQVLYANCAIRFRLQIAATHLLRNGSPTVRSPATILDQLAILFENMHSSLDSALSPHIFHSLLPSPFCSTNQQDAAEFIHILFDKLADYSLTTEIQMQTLTTMTCDKCKTPKITRDVELVLDIPLPSDTAPTNLQTLVDSALSPELMIGVGFKCDKCFDTHGASDATKTYSVAIPPPTLLLSMKRFAFDSQRHTATKILTHVTVPHHLILPVLGSHGATYKLRAVIAHNGNSAQIGHYIALLHFDERAFVFDDANVHNETINNPLTTPYVCMYCRSEH